jgi:hypothetical protein
MNAARDLNHHPPFLSSTLPVALFSFIFWTFPPSDAL